MKLVSLNAAGDRFFPRQLAFFKSCAPDVVCLQEASSQIVPVIMSELRMDGRFAPMWIDQSVADPLGIAILSRLNIEHFEITQYGGDAFRNHTNPAERACVAAPKLLACMSTRDDHGRLYVIATTHFTWSSGGMATAEQRDDMTRLLKALEKYPEVVFSGDFNAPRGREIFDLLAQTYRDNIPAHHRTSIDGTLHRAGALELMIDGLFSTREFHVTDVELVAGISDHYAIVAEIS